MHIAEFRLQIALLQFGACFSCRLDAVKCELTPTMSRVWGAHDQNARARTGHSEHSKILNTEISKDIRRTTE